MPADPNQPENAEEAIFPLLYHAHHREYVEDIPFWLDLARQKGSPILELGCGTGRVTIPLADAGYAVIGLDHDPEMLKTCQQLTPPALSARIQFMKADLTAFQIGIQFPLIILPCNTYSTLQSKSRKSALICISQHLIPGGVFATSIPNPVILAELESSEEAEIETHFPHPTTGNPIQVSYEIIRKDQDVTLLWHYDHLLPNGQAIRSTVSTLHYLTTTDRYLDEFMTAGFNILSSCGDFDSSPHRPDSPNLIIIAEKL